MGHTSEYQLRSRFPLDINKRCHVKLGYELPAGKQPQLVQGRSLLCYWATSELGISQVWLSRKLGITQAAVSLSVARGRQVAIQNTYEIGNL